MSEAFKQEVAEDAENQKGRFASAISATSC